MVLSDETRFRLDTQCIERVHNHTRCLGHDRDEGGWEGVSLPTSKGDGLARGYQDNPTSHLDEKGERPAHLGIPSLAKDRKSFS